MLEQPYRKWLEREGYQPSTIKTTIASMHVAEREFNVQGLRWKPSAPVASLLRRYARFLNRPSFRRGDDEQVTFEQFVLEHFQPPSHSKPVTGSSHKAALTSEQWQALVASVCSGDKPADTVLCAMLSLPTLNPTQALTVPIEELARYAILPRLSVLRKYKTLGRYLSGSTRGAYLMVNKRLKKHAADLGLELDFKLLARTPASVRAAATVV